jgi:hypothetical protein
VLGEEDGARATDPAGCARNDGSLVTKALHALSL